jgi:hypothetical protein
VQLKRPTGLTSQHGGTTMKSLLSESVCAGVFGLILAATTHAETIVDTGPGPQTFVGYAIDENISQAVEFSINSSYTITDIQFWMFPESGSSGSAGYWIPASAGMTYSDVPNSGFKIVTESYNMSPCI